jgi:hypothetical protein
MARLIFNGAHREVLWALTSGGRPRTLPADNLDDPAVHLLAMGPELTNWPSGTHKRTN